MVRSGGLLRGVLEALTLGVRTAAKHRLVAIMPIPSEPLAEKRVIRWADTDGMADHRR